MAKYYNDFTKWKHANTIAKEGNCFILERIEEGKTQYILYRKCSPRNIRIGKRSTIDGILQLVKKATTIENV